MSWLTNQLIEHESGRRQEGEKWWDSPFGFNYLDVNDPDEDERFEPSGPPPGWQRLPLHEES